MSSERVDSPTQPMPDLVLHGRYRLDRRLGRGGMADVWAGEDLLLGRPVAVKLFRFDMPGTERGRIEAEMRTIAQLSHPGIVTVHDASPAAEQDDGEFAGSPYLVMELVDGESLSDRLARGPLPARDAAYLAAQLARALAYVHSRGIVHRDVKPANILLQPPQPDDAPAPFRARLTDFGIARLADSTRITTVGMTVGTANYLSPEQATAEEVGPAADIYSLGLVLLEALTGRVAYPGVGVAAASARLHRPPAIPTALGPQWSDLLHAMTASDPVHRPTAAEVAADVTAWPIETFDRTASVESFGDADATTLLLSPATIGNADDTQLLTDPSAPVSAPASEKDSIRQRLRAHRLPPLNVRRLNVRRLSLARLRAKPLLLAAAAVVAVIVIVLIVALSSHSSGGTGPKQTTTPSPAVQYPSVGGQLGNDLRQLESSVG